MKGKATFFILLLATVFSSMAQSAAQARLLRKAYKMQSTAMLFKFFDNWSEEVKSNERMTKDPYVEEAYKVFDTFYQPMRMNDRQGSHLTMYDDKPYFIVQGSLWKICKTDNILYKPKEIDSFVVTRIRPLLPNDTSSLIELISSVRNDTAKLSYVFWEDRSCAITNPILVDSDIEFRPPVHFGGKKVVYLTKKYKKVLDSFLGDKHVDFGKHNIMQPSFSKEESQLKQEFINNAARIFYGHWGGYWQYETYPQANQIIINSEMNRAIVLYRFIYSGGEVLLEKNNGDWSVVKSRYTWIE